MVDVNTFFFEGVESGDDRLLFLLDTAKAFDSIDHSWIHTVIKKTSFSSLFCQGALRDVKVSPYFGKDFPPFSSSWPMTPFWINSVGSPVSTRMPLRMTLPLPLLAASTTFILLSP